MPEWVTIDNIINVLVIAAAVYIFFWVRNVMPVLREARDDYKAALDAKKERLKEFEIDKEKLKQDLEGQIKNAEELMVEVMADVVRSFVFQLVITQGWDYTKKVIREDMKHKWARDYFTKTIEEKEKLRQKMLSNKKKFKSSSPPHQNIPNS